MPTDPIVLPLRLTCYGCIHLTCKWYGDGTTLYGCALVPGLVKGCVSAFDDDEPTACDKYTPIEADDAK